MKIKTTLTVIALTLAPTLALADGGLHVRQAAIGLAMRARHHLERSDPDLLGAEQLIQRRRLRRLSGAC